MEGTARPSQLGRGYLYTAPALLEGPATIPLKTAHPPPQPPTTSLAWGQTEQVPPAAGCLRALGADLARQTPRHRQARLPCSAQPHRTPTPPTSLASAHTACCLWRTKVGLPGEHRAEPGLLTETSGQLAG